VDLYPAIDLLGGAVVRLTQGRYDEPTVYRSDPVEVAQEFEAAGAQWVHVVDLEAARSGTSEQTAVVGEICSAVHIPVECGGGVRDRDRAGALLDAGVARVVMGTAAAEDAALFGAVASRWPGRVAAGLDHRGGEVRVRGWEEGSGRQVLELAAQLAGEGAAAIIVTDIGRDGMLSGPDTAGLTDALDAASGVPVIASGGVGGVADIRRLAGLRSPGGHQLAGVIVGRALYEGVLAVPDALEACRTVPA
jgi:phosphoribosylformimino-5-aminoimidazole carboxamide ribotide isomerase